MCWVTVRELDFYGWFLVLNAFHALLAAYSGVLVYYLSEGKGPGVGVNIIEGVIRMGQ